eukprot:CAMPEP_0115183886 /NCGR_PEP_ID=MMETSP0270-20121206/8680_1 /TAXON_ID=71861 /ORGANISM="Scrippsiella trochoidea, Strain CCMP3099" /LENGTH=119 /DNA_ID=CAMNT_0002596959 /DNA_START=286 /DNA_END=647 /DNA_ORIENTATION=-
MLPVLMRCCGGDSGAGRAKAAPAEGRLPRNVLFEADNASGRAISSARTNSSPFQAAQAAAPARYCAALGLFVLAQQSAENPAAETFSAACSLTAKSLLSTLELARNTASADLKLIDVFV